MSYILDALKKSEEERHQGQVPNLGSNSALIHNPKTKSSLLPWVIVALLILNVSFVIFWVFKEPTATLTSAETSLSVAKNDSLVGSNNEPLGSESISQGAMYKVEERTAVNQIEVDQIAVESAIEDKRVNYTHEVVTDQVVTNQVISAPLADGRYKSASVTTNKSVMAKQTTQPELVVPRGGSMANYEETVVDVAEEAPLLITPKGKSRPYAGPAYVPEVVEQTNTTQANEAGTYNETSRQSDQPAIENMASIPRLSDQPHSFQIQIPDMAFNSHIYTDTPSARRVMINNIYLREGQTFSGMRVEQITEEGIVLSLKNEPFKIGVLRDWYSPR